MTSLPQLFPTRPMEQLNAVTAKVIGAAMKVHTRLGPGLLESAYTACLAYELRKGGLKTLAEVALPIVYDEVQLDVGYRLDLLVEDCVVVELKSVEKLSSLHQAQLLSYLKLSGIRLGLLINFNVTSLKNDGIRRIMN
ncbi:GxxExxY protein [Verrucomicrobium spinosum]|uniref:GxxExxY protein n=2 Tax=Verrucomicrobium spinosum TaxID=2736 RepID=UPI00017452F9